LLPCVILSMPILIRMALVENGYDISLFEIIIKHFW
jgi:hypothetical protein